MLGPKQLGQNPVPLNIAEGNGKQNLKDKNRYFQIARGSALESAAVHDLLKAFALIDEAMGCADGIQNQVQVSWCQGFLASIIWMQFVPWRERVFKSSGKGSTL